MIEKILKKSFNENLYLNKLSLNKLKKQILLVSNTFKQKVKKNNTIFWCGNGGSASQSEHLSAELVGRFKKIRKPINSISLTANPTYLTCVSNDFEFKDIFSRQLEAHGKKNDLLIVFSTSGKSKNIIEVLKMAKKKKITSVGFLGNSGGDAKKLCDFDITIPSSSTARIQELHLLIGHVICEFVDFKKTITKIVKKNN